MSCRTRNRTWNRYITSKDGKKNSSPPYPCACFTTKFLEVAIVQHHTALHFFFTGGQNNGLKVHINTTNLSSAFVVCTFVQQWYNCTIDYGTNSSYTNLVYRDTSSTLDLIANITLSERLIENTMYYYIVSAESSSQCVRVQGRFKTGK